ncbi:cell wall-active antibiotics response protein [Haloferax sp. AB510]|uniref:LiaF transmembrane domain-containing protein n=1 Tax=Haloferax sp. AB510 TaxID=2934172 RepID=UPI00209C46C1|nr:LiaF domain-containing protein [Haloferax sp. AB510]MCO8267266.1 cell wall-active antibiotics response protein [Haloferax sp. AB510]
MAYRRVSNQVVVGAAVVLVGLVLLANTTRLYDTTGLFRYLPSLFVLAGLYALVVSGFRNVGGPLVLVAVAGAWQAVALGFVTAGEIVSFWPVLLVILGLSIAVGRIRSSVEPITGERVDLVAVFGGRDARVTTSRFAGGAITAIFGAVELDLRDVVELDGTARIDVTALFGGAEITVPRDWNVRLDVLPVFGAAEDERPRRELEHETVDLVVSGFSAFGGVSVTD